MITTTFKNKQTVKGDYLPQQDIPEIELPYDIMKWKDIFGNTHYYLSCDRTDCPPIKNTLNGKPYEK